MKKKILFGGLGTALFIVGVVVGTVFSFDTLYSGDYTREHLEKKQVENTLSVPLVYNVRTTTNLSASQEVVPEALNQAELGLVDIPDGQKVEILSPDSTGSFLGGEYIYIEVNDPVKFTVAPEIRDDIQSFDKSSPIETVKISNYVITEQSRERYGSSTFGSDVQLCQISAYLIDVNDAGGFPVARLRYHQNMCKPSLVKVWQELRENLLNASNWK